MSATVTYNGAEIATVENETKVLQTAGTYCEDNITITDASATINLQAKTGIAPTTSSQTITADSGYDGLSSVQINAMPTGSAGTPTATKGAVSNHSVSVTPSVTNTTGYITGSTKTGTAVTVSASELVVGSQTITENGTVDVTNLAEIVVAVESGGGGVETVNVDVFTVGGGANCIYYTDANMTFQTNSAKMAKVTAPLPKGSILVAKEYTTVRKAVGVTLIATIASSTNIYEVTG